MTEELEELWKKLTFTEEEGAGIVLDNSSTRAAKEVGKFCVVMKILTQRSINLETVRKNIRMLWKPNKGVKISEIDEDLFLCRIKETGWAIGSSLGLVLDVDVPEFGVQWSKCLRVRVPIDATKRLVRGKKITIKGGAWLRGDPLQRGGYEMAKSGFRSEAEGNSEKTEGRTARTPTVSQVPSKDAEAGRHHVSEKTSLKISNPMLSQVGTAPHAPLSEALHEKGNLKEWVGKIRGREASLGCQDKVQVINHAEACSGRQLNLKKWMNCLEVF
nr:hypothetical protein CFP56_06749 [Quercus suber]